MDAIIKTITDDFLNFLVKEFKTDKHLRHVQFEKWSLTEGYKIDVRFYYQGKEGHVFIDARELKENQNDFLHLKDNIIWQINKVLDKA